MVLKGSPEILARAGLVVVFALRKPAPRAAAQRLGAVGALGRSPPPAIARAEFSQRENCHQQNGPTGAGPAEAKRALLLWAASRAGGAGGFAIGAALYPASGFLVGAFAVAGATADKGSDADERQECNEVFHIFGQRTEPRANRRRADPPRGNSRGSRCQLIVRGQAVWAKLTSALGFSEGLVTLAPVWLRLVHFSTPRNRSSP